MLKRVIICLAVALASSAALVNADPKDDIKAAVQKVVDAGSYTWTTQTEGGFMRGQQDGKTDKDGYTSMSMEMRDNKIEIITKGDKVVIKMDTDNAWKTPAELASENTDDGGGPNPGRFAAMMARNIRTPLQQAQENVDDLQKIQKTDDGFTADLSPEAAKKLLSFRPRRQSATTAPDGDNAAPQIDVSDAKANVKLTIKDGNLTQMVLHVTGTVSFNGNDRDVDRTTTTDIKDIGSTTVDVPAEAKAKLGA